MDSIGHKLVKNSVIGAGAGAAVGLGVGIWKNHQAMEAVPTLFGLLCLQPFFPSNQPE